MTKKEIDNWRRSTVVRRIIHFLGRIGVNSLNVHRIEVSIKFQSDGTLVISNLEAFLKSEEEPVKFSGDNLIPLIIGKLRHIVDDREEPTNEVRITIFGYNSFKYEFDAVAT